ncbi:sensor histidine kinase [Hellea balneolensis]|uniref:sensor histidine kinase n=1 Tax=Hellea balneolensis TaxID=287478 RepID=UPI00040721F3|nr:histidine kinase dimerization/phosphoacceptor domain -containing protein [Hellea balneolensis]
MKDLRVRLGVILALALWPLLVFSIWRSYQDYTQDQILIDRNADLTARAALSETVHRFETTQTILRFLTTRLSGGSCETDLAQLIEEYPRFHNIVRGYAAGNVVCSAKPVRKIGQPVADLIASLSEGKPFVTQILTAPASDEAPGKILVTVYGHYENGTLTEVAAAVENLTLLLDLLEESKVLEDGDLAVFNQSGQILGGRWENNDLQTVAQSLPLKKLEGRYSTVDANGNDVLVLPTPADQIYLAVASKKQDVFSWNRLNPLTSALIPMIAWLFGFIAIWLSTDQLVLSHLRRMRTAAATLARGNRGARVGDLNNPPAEISALAKSFDIMANRLVEREAIISDALDEKETLLREIHHRVKNNLQIIISLLNMQERKLSNTEGLAAIIAARSRINAIALVHRGLYESTDLRVVDMDIFLNRLLPELAIAFGLDEKNISVSTKVECQSLEADTATPVALFIVEALTNSVKHGIPRGGHVDIELKQIEKLIHVSVFDNGQSDFTSKDEKSGIGSKLMKGFARQLGGTLNVQNNESGYKTVLSFTPRETPQIG